MSGPNCAVHVLCMSSHLLLCAPKMVPPTPPLNHTFLKQPFLTEFKDILAHRTESSENLGKVPKPTELAHYDDTPRDMSLVSRGC